MTRPNLKTKSKRNWAENERLIAKGFSRTNKDGGIFHFSDLTKLTKVDRSVIRRHLRGNLFFSRNRSKVSNAFYSRLNGVSAPEVFAIKFLSCVIEYKEWFGLDFWRGRYRLFETLMDRLEPVITRSWQKQTKRQRTFFYERYCFEVFRLLQCWYQNGFSENLRPEITEKLSKLTAAFATGNSNMIRNTVEYL